MPEFRMIEFSRPADREEGKQSGWIALVDEQGAELWHGWVSPVPLDLWGAMQDSCRPDPEAELCEGIGISEPGSEGRYVAARCGSTSTHRRHWLDGRDYEDESDTGSSPVGDR